jgi:hypothetical protein
MIRMGAREGMREGWPQNISRKTLDYFQPFSLRPSLIPSLGRRLSYALDKFLLLSPELE